MIKGLSPRAQKLLMVQAYEEVKKSGSEQLLPEHLLIALINNADSLAYSVLQYLKFGLFPFKMALERSLPEKRKSKPFSEVIHSRRLQLFLDVALKESKNLKREYVGTEHFLLAAINEEKSVTCDYFKNAGLSINDVKSAIEVVSIQMPSSAQSTSLHSLTEPSFPKMEKAAQSTRDSLLEEHSRDLTEKARLGELDPVVGRKKEVQRVVQILSRRGKNNPVLIGEPGVGKTAIAEGLAQRIVNASVPDNLMYKRLVVLDLASVIAGTKYRGEFEDRLKRIMKEIKEKKNIILFIDELHTIIGAGGAEGSMDASNILKPALSRGEIQCIGATTIKEYRKYFEKDPALERRFQTVQINEPSDEETKDILLGIKSRYEEFHGVKYVDDIFDTIILFSKRYITDRFLPDKAIDILDEAGAMKKVSEVGYPDIIHALQSKIDYLTSEKQQVIKNQNYESAAHVRDQIKSLKIHLEELQQDWKQRSGKNIVTINDICTVISNITGIPSTQLNESETSRLVDMEQELHNTVVSQDEAVRVISSAIRRSRAGVSSTQRPLGSFIFLGPTGVGKTLLAKALAKFLFGAEDSLVRIDMSDYMEKHNSSRLVGAPPGYVGYDEGGILTEKIRRNPYAVILLDEIEKAHADVFNILLQVLEEGELRDNLGHVVNFRNTVIIMTSNAGVRQISNGNKLGFNSNEKASLNYEDIKIDALSELKKIMSPELINRIDDTIVFSPLDNKEIGKILDIQLKDFAVRLAEKDLILRVTPKAKAYLTENGYEPAFGARPMRRLIQREIEDALSMKIICGECAPLDTVIVDCKTRKGVKSLFLKIEKCSILNEKIPEEVGTISSR